MIAATVDWKLLLTIGILAALVIVLVYRLMRRDPNVRHARYGFFVERDRFDDDEPGPRPGLVPHTALPNWPDRDQTAELPPEPPGASPTQ